ncbi:DsrE family protein [Haloarchaeobius iranensis]|uniref:DsrE/DsrF-like family protein n=1 Tax=Haloarchaeobius iranensis TaxID=996166 RepID=A0A1G9SY97_9EURY|nr:DsrE family protein [Haloarchaeobius iranensis]SDM39825.1 DsrE/DsrF-like family protein [Haloarchaeobius iranensis]
MGLLDSLFKDGGTPTEDGTESDDGTTGGRAPTAEGGTGTKYAILMNAGPDDFAAAGNGFQYAIELDDAGYEVDVFLDGVATKWPAEFADDPGRPFSRNWTLIEQRDLLAGACGYCANAFDSQAACEASGVTLLSDSDEHAPAVAQLADEGYEILTI